MVRIKTHCWQVLPTYIQRGGQGGNLCGRALELQEHHGIGTLHDVKIEQLGLFPVMFERAMDIDNVSESSAPNQGCGMWSDALQKA